jgi:NTE family protein
MVHSNPPDNEQKPRGGANFEQIALLLQGGGALGSYQAGAYQALAENDLRPDWVAGVSIGAVNSALIAGNAPGKRVEKLREFWETVSSPPLGLFGVRYNPSVELQNERTHRLVNQTRALGVAMLGAPGFFKPRFPPAQPWLTHDPGEVSYYEVAPLKATLERLVDFDRINKSGEMRFSVGAVNVRTGNLVYFDTQTHRISVGHVIASGSLPPGFPPAEIDGEYYWDGGIVSNTPLQWVLDSRPRKDTLAFQIDLWSSRGEPPRDLVEADVRLKDIQYSSRTRSATDQYKKAQKIRLAVANLLRALPADLRAHEDVKMLEAEADDKVCNIIHLIYDCKSYEGVAKDYEFSRRTMEEHWRDGYNDALRALGHPEILQRPSSVEGVRTFDFSEAGDKEKSSQSPKVNETQVESSQ